MHDSFHALISGQRQGLWPGCQRLGLKVLSLFYGLGVRSRNRLFELGWKKSVQAQVPVISVGNLTAGGTGKTPCVEYVARFLRERGLRVAILSRGYGAQTGPNDEALVLEENLPDVPHLQDADRAALAGIAVEELESEVLVLDDGFQHRGLARDFDLVLIDATQPWGWGHLLPRGLLREPRRCLRRADFVLLTRCDLVRPDDIEILKNEVTRWAPSMSIATSEHGPAHWLNASRQTLPLESLQGRPLAGFCGIGNPEAFKQTLTRLGLNVQAWRSFPDHHPYTRADIESLRQWGRDLPAETVLVTTQKDLVKVRLDRLGDRDLWALQIQLRVTAGQEALEQALERVASATPTEASA